MLRTVIASSFASKVDIELYTEVAKQLSLSLVEIFEYWVHYSLKIPLPVLKKFYKKNGHTTSSVLDTDVEEHLGNQKTEQQLFKLNRKYQTWLQKKQLEKQQ